VGAQTGLINSEMEEGDNAKLGESFQKVMSHRQRQHQVGSFVLVLSVQRVGPSSIARACQSFAKPFLFRDKPRRHMRLTYAKQDRKMCCQSCR
jgi:hypothetical protein